jgi:hypothetical protein
MVEWIYADSPANTVLSGYTGTLPSDLLIPANVLSIADGTFDEVTGIPLTGVFLNQTGITSVTFHVNSQLTEIGSAAFYGCSGILGSISTDDGTVVGFSLPSSIAIIGRSAFEGCTGIDVVGVTDNLTTIGDSAFSGCSRVTTIFLCVPYSDTLLGVDAFNGVDTTEIHIEDTSTDWPDTIINGGITFTVVRDISRGGGGDGGAAAGGGGDGGAAAGDPYVNTITGKIYKLPAFNGALRLYQGHAAGKLLTINATTRIDDDKAAMDADTAKMNAMLATPVTHDLQMTEAMSFFDKIHVQLGDAHAVFSVYDGFRVESPVPAVWDLQNKGTLANYLKGLPFYAHLAGSVHELSPCEGVTIRMGIVPIRHIRSTVEVAAPNMAAGSGALVHRLSRKQMSLKKLADTRPLSARSDAAIKRAIRETFVCDKTTTTTDIAFLG